MAYLHCRVAVISRKMWSFFPLSFWKEVVSLGEALSDTSKTRPQPGLQSFSPRVNKQTSWARGKRGTFKGETKHSFGNENWNN